MLRTRVLRLGLLLACLAPALSAQDSVATLKGTTLIIKGSDGVDAFTLSNVPDLADGEAGPASVLVSPGKGATVNGSTEPTSFDGVLKLKISLGEGGDVLAFQDFNFAGSVSVNGGGGVDIFTATNSNVGPFKFGGDAGDDEFTATSSDFGASVIKGGPGALSMTTDDAFFSTLKLTGGEGIDELHLAGHSTVDFAFTLKLAAGSDTVDFNGLTVGSSSTFDLGAGNDVFEDRDGFYGEFLNIIAGTGNDTIVFDQATLGNSLSVKLSAGINQLTLKGTDSSMTVGNDLTIKGGPDVDTIKLLAGPVPSAFVLIGNSLIAGLKSGSNELQASGDVDFGNDLSYAGGGLDDLLHLDGTSIGVDANIALSGGTNDVILDDCGVGLDLRITGGNGDDTVQLNGATDVGGLTLIHLGGGNNSQP